MPGFSELHRTLVDPAARAPPPRMRRAAANRTTPHRLQQLDTAAAGAVTEIGVRLRAALPELPLTGPRIVHDTAGQGRTCAGTPSPTQNRRYATAFGGP